MEKVLIVDGHSAIHATDWLLDIHTDHHESGREALVRELTQLQQMTDFYVVIVFDGKGHTRGKQGGNEKEALVMYSRTNETADRVIERISVKANQMLGRQIGEHQRTRNYPGSEASSGQKVGFGRIHLVIAGDPPRNTGDRCRKRDKRYRGDHFLLTEMRSSRKLVYVGCRHVGTAIIRDFNHRDFGDITVEGHVCETP